VCLLTTLKTANTSYTLLLNFGFISFLPIFAGDSPAFSIKNIPNLLIINILFLRSRGLLRDFLTISGSFYVAF